MALTQREIGFVVEELRQVVGESRVQEVRDAGPRRIVLALRAPGVTRHLLVDTSTGATRLHLIEDAPEQPPEPAPFTMQLRKWLRRAEVAGIEQMGEDRLVRLDFEAIDPEWEPLEEGDRRDPPTRAVSLVAELADRVGNIYLIDDEETILGMQTDETIAGRALSTGDVWTDPPPPPAPEAGLEVRWDLGERDPSEFERSAEIERVYRRRQRRERAENELDALRSRLEDRVEQLERRVEHIEEDLADIGRADTYRRWADLLQSAYGEVDSGAESVTVRDYYREDQAEIEIPLDGSKSLSENIDHYYHQAERYENARDMVERRLLETVELRDRASAALDALDSPDAPEHLDAIDRFRDDLDDDLLVDRPEGGGDRRDADQRRPYRSFTAQSGATLMVGRRAADNDTLVTRIARGRDLWLHARNAPGAAVIMRIDRRGADPDPEDLVDAATLAAHFSQRRGDTTIEVSYTRAKHVRKHAGHATGAVSIAEESTIAVVVEQQRLERLLETEQ